jgi:hypothetical protein
MFGDGRRPSTAVSTGVLTSAAHDGFEPDQVFEAMSCAAERDEIGRQRPGHYVAYLTGSVSAGTMRSTAAEGALEEFGVARVVNTIVVSN